MKPLFLAFYRKLEETDMRFEPQGCRKSVICAPLTPSPVPSAGVGVKNIIFCQ